MISTQENWRKLSTVVHMVNRDLYLKCNEANEKKLQKILPQRREVIQEQKVFRIPSTVQLSQEEESFLEKGLSFVPKSEKVDPFHSLNDAEEFYRKLD